MNQSPTHRCGDLQMAKVHASCSCMVWRRQKPISGESVMTFCMPRGIGSWTDKDRGRSTLLVPSQLSLIAPSLIPKFFVEIVMRAMY